MAETSIGQADEFFTSMSQYFSGTRDYYQNASSTPPNFMELLSGMKFTQLINESQKYAKGNPSMVSGALIESTNAIFSVLREAGMRAKTRADFFADAESSASADSTFYSTQGQSMKGFMRGQNDMQG